MEALDMENGPSGYGGGGGLMARGGGNSSFSGGAYWSGGEDSPEYGATRGGYGVGDRGGGAGKIDDDDDDDDDDDYDRYGGYRGLSSYGQETKGKYDAGGGDYKMNDLGGWQP